MADRSYSYLAAASGTADVQLRAAPLKVRGWSARESAGTAASASFVLRDGTSASASGVIFVELNPDQSTFVLIETEEGIEFGTALYLDRITGTTEVTVFV